MDWPKCAFGVLVGKKYMPFCNPPHWGTENCGLFNIFLTFIGQKGVFWVKNGVLGVFWTEFEVADLKPRQSITTMEHMNKIPSLVLPTYMTLETPQTASLKIALFL